MFLAGRNEYNPLLIFILEFLKHIPANVSRLIIPCIAGYPFPFYAALENSISFLSKTNFPALVFTLENLCFYLMGKGFSF
ncbi:hypothetical protein HMPREF3293_01584 [Christensenella minuta]|uniref:Uncharacterized protein n=1 Tax=Christensenella minuta TaxID=626937 RepID=A0A136Q3Z4_9FIRM|nr:hypothetical protein HMPREF3293_01584 [Christensenella minuta]